MRTVKRPRTALTNRRRRRRTTWRRYFIRLFSYNPYPFPINSFRFSSILRPLFSRLRWWLSVATRTPSSACSGLLGTAPIVSLPPGITQLPFGISNWLERFPESGIPRLVWEREREREREQEQEDNIYYVYMLPFGFVCSRFPYCLSSLFLSPCWVPFWWVLIPFL